MKIEPKPVSASAIEDHTYAIFPNDLNSHNTVFGGIVMGLCDRVAGVVAARHANCICVTAAVDSFHFLSPVGKGELLVLKGSVNRTWNTSMEIGIRVVSEDIATDAHRHVVSAYFTFVALDEHNHPKKVPAVLPGTEAQHRRYEEANERRERRRKEADQRKKIRGEES